MAGFWWIWDGLGISALVLFGLFLWFAAKVAMAFLRYALRPAPPLKVAKTALGSVQIIRGDFPMKLSFDVEIEGMKEIDNLIAMLSPLAEAERKSKVGN